MRWRTAEYRKQQSEYYKQRLENDPELAKRRRQAARDWHAANRPKVAVRHATWVDQNRHRVNAKELLRYTGRVNATPPWAKQIEIGRIYDRAAQLTADTGIPHEVDHVIPLRHKLVCGLHCEANLQVITKAANGAKSNIWP
jgi:hypothetical protein